MPDLLCLVMYHVHRSWECEDAMEIDVGLAMGAPAPSVHRGVESDHGAQLGA